jgi:hypothetical protein
MAGPVPIDPRKQVDAASVQLTAMIGACVRRRFPSRSLAYLDSATVNACIISNLLR